MTREEKLVRFVHLTERVQRVFLRRLVHTLKSIGGCVELLPHVDQHYRHWLKALRRRELVALRRLQLWRYHPPKATPIGNMYDLLERVN